MQTDKVFGAPATGTADAFLEALGLALLLGSVAMFLVFRLNRREALL
jgi:LPXTG-motif cell wall-anchored protein